MVCIKSSHFLGHGTSYCFFAAPIREFDMTYAIRASAQMWQSQVVWAALRNIQNAPDSLPSLTRTGVADSSPGYRTDSTFEWSLVLWGFVLSLGVWGSTVSPLSVRWDGDIYIHTHIFIPIECPKVSERIYLLSTSIQKCSHLSCSHIV